MVLRKICYNMVSEGRFFGSRALIFLLNILLFVKALPMRLTLKYNETDFYDNQQSI
jgi:hypothetical protein